PSGRKARPMTETGWAGSCRGGASGLSIAYAVSDGGTWFGPPPHQPDTTSSRPSGLNRVWLGRRLGVILISRTTVSEDVSQTRTTRSELPPASRRPSGEYATV